MMGNQRFDRQDAISLYASGLSLRQVATRLGVTHQAIAAGIAPRQRHKLTKGALARRRIVQAIAGHHFVMNECPTLKEVAAYVGLSLTATRMHIMRLIRDGWLVMDNHSGRTLRLTKCDGRPAVTIYERKVN